MLQLIELWRYPIINNALVYFDMWSLNHFFSGVLLGLILSKKRSLILTDQEKTTTINCKLKNGVVILFTLFSLISFEFIEPCMILDGFVESKLNVLWDIIYGMLGCITVIFYKVSKRDKN